VTVDRDVAEGPLTSGYQLPMTALMGTSAYAWPLPELEGLRLPTNMWPTSQLGNRTWLVEVVAVPLRDVTITLRLDHQGGLIVGDRILPRWDSLTFTSPRSGASYTLVPGVFTAVL